MDCRTSWFELSFGAIASTVIAASGSASREFAGLQRPVRLAVAVCPRRAPRQDRVPALTLLASGR
jgi:hypothetical protein